MLRRVIAGQGGTVSETLVGSCSQPVFTCPTDHDRVLMQLKINVIGRMGPMIGI
jgi:hypothetical protein